MAFNPYPNLSGQVNLVAPNRSVTTPGRRPLADVSVVGEAYRNMGQVISNLGGKAAEVALRAKLDDERLAHDEATLAFASGLNQHEMDMRNNPQKYANMKYEDMQSNYMGDFGPDGTLISTIIKPYEDKPELQKSIKNISFMNYDYLIVGAGSAGCVLANRLSENNNHKVAIFEAGGSSDIWKVKMPLALLYTMHDPKYNWKYYSEP